VDQNSVTLIVAAVGVTGTLLAPRLATKATHRNTLDVLERQEAEQARIREDDAAECRQTAFQAERRRAYVDLLRSAILLERAKERLASLEEEHAAVIERAEETAETLDAWTSITEAKAAVVEHLNEAYHLVEGIKPAGSEQGVVGCRLVRA
jgi:hypothetical protein